MLKDSPLKEVGDVDRPGHRIAVGENSAYDLYLTRTLKHATLLRTPGGCCKNIDLFRAEKLDAVAGVRQPLADYAKANADVRVMTGAFQQIRQAMGTPQRPARGRGVVLRAFIEEMKGERVCRRGAQALEPARRAGRARGDQLTRATSPNKKGHPS